MDSNENSNLPAKRLNFLITQEDMYGTDIVRMSDFFEVAISELSSDLVLSEKSTIGIDDIATINTMKDVIKAGKAMMIDNTILVPDFDRLPKTIKEKIQSGEYSLGDSRKDEGNLRAVIVDTTNNNQRVADVTLKKVDNSPDTQSLSRDMALQMQLKEISGKLESIQELQSYHLDLTRNQSIINPFLEGRSFLLEAQNAKNEYEQKIKLSEAQKCFSKSITALYTDIRTTSEHFSKIERLPLTPVKNLYMKNLTTDVQYLHKMVGVQANVYHYLGENENAKALIDGYQHNMNLFFSQKINGGYTAAQLLQSYYPYNENNRDMWHDFSNAMVKRFDYQERLSNKDVLVLEIKSVEGNDE